MTLDPSRSKTPRFQEQLKRNYACRDAIRWVGDKNLQEAWKECTNGFWMIWLLDKMQGKEGWLNEKEILKLELNLIIERKNHFNEKVTLQKIDFSEADYIRSKFTPEGDLL
jgi:hypothetical protein